jgi:GTP 3',8-cyclase
MRQAIEHKPAAHCFERPGQITESHNMISIGG